MMAPSPGNATSNGVESQRAVIRHGNLRIMFADHALFGWIKRLRRALGHL